MSLSKQLKIYKKQFFQIFLIILLFYTSWVAWFRQATQLDPPKEQSLNFAWPQCINPLLKIFIYPLLRYLWFINQFNVFPYEMLRNQIESKQVRGCKLVLLRLITRQMAVLFRYLKKQLYKDISPKLSNFRQIFKNY